MEIDSEVLLHVRMMLEEYLQPAVQTAMREIAATYGDSPEYTAALRAVRVKVYWPDDDRIEE
jgi:hypothetical protein